jgi:murein L,D-transpeptidase YafK
MRLSRMGMLLLLLAGASAARADDLAANDGAGPLHSATVEIWKSRRNMELRDGDRVVRRFKVVLGSTPHDAKQTQGDGRTPVGNYFVSEKHAQSRFRHFIGLNYPNADDADRGYGARLIGPDQWADIFLATLRGSAPPWSTVLGGRVGIHGFGGRPYLPIDWTQGCIAISDEEIDYLFDRVFVGTPVIIHE